MITKELIENRIKSFWDYGNIRSKTWFIGMEEGFHGDKGDLETRFRITKDRAVIDLREDMKAVSDHSKWFSADSNIQRTWGKLIHILLVLDHVDQFDNNKIKEYQINNLGKLEGDHCILEFMPLPCRSTRKKDWFYDQFKIDYLKTRKEYIKNIMPKRISLLKDLIASHASTTIIFYSLKYFKQWVKVSGHDFQEEGKMFYCQDQKNNYFIIPHPVAHGMTNQDWEKIAHDIKRFSNR